MLCFDEPAPLAGHFLNFPFCPARLQDPVSRAPSVTVTAAGAVKNSNGRTSAAAAALREDEDVAF